MALPFERLVLFVDVGEVADWRGQVPLRALCGSGVTVGRDHVRVRPIDFCEQVAGPFGEIMRAGGGSGEGLAIVDDVGHGLSFVDKTLTQQGQSHGVKSADSQSAADSESLEPAAHLAGGLARERDRKNILGLGAADGDAVGDAIGEHACLARTRTSVHNCRRGRRSDRLALLVVKAIEKLLRIHGNTLRPRCRTRRNTHRRERFRTDYYGDMAFPEKSLNEHEELIVDLNPHWWHFASPLAGLVLATVIAVLLSRLADAIATSWFNSLKNWLMVLIVGAALLNLIVRMLQWSTTHFVVTSDRVIFREGIIGKTGIDIPLDRVNNVSIHQSVLERMVGAGDLLIESGGEDGQQLFTDISSPEEVQNIIHNAIRVHGGSDSDGGNRGSINRGSSSVSQLERLEAMLQRGSITRAEFEEQKRRILG